MLCLSTLNRVYFFDTVYFFFIDSCRGFTVETCIVVQHVGGATATSPHSSPVAKKPCPPAQVIHCSIIFDLLVFLHSKEMHIVLGSLARYMSLTVSLFTKKHNCV